MLVTCKTGNKIF